MGTTAGSVDPAFVHANLLVFASVGRFAARARMAEDEPSAVANLLALLDVASRGGKPIHDSVLVATMPVHRIPRLLARNVADFGRFAVRSPVAP